MSPIPAGLLEACFPPTPIAESGNPQGFFLNSSPWMDNMGL